MSDPKQKMLMFVVVLGLASVNSQASISDVDRALIYVTMAPNVYVNVIPGDPLLWTEFAGAPPVSSIPLVGQYSITQTDFDYKNKRGFWAETNGADGGRALGYVSLNFTQLLTDGSLGNSFNPIFRGMSSSTRGIAVDWIGNNIYWTDGVYNRIAVAPIVTNSNVFSVLVEVSVEEPGGIVVYPQKGLMFWTVYGRNGRIYKSTMSGDNRILIMEDDQKPSGIAIDYTSETLYWIDEPSGQIEMIDMHGNNRQVIYTDNGAQYYGINVYKGYLFLTEQNNNTIDILDIASKTKVRSIAIPSQSGTAYDIEVYADGIQEEYTSPCAVAGCEHFCVLEPNNGTKCMCNFGYMLTNGTNCTVESLLQPQFVFASRTHLDVYPFNFPDRDQTEIEMNGASNRMYGSQWHYYTNVAFNSKAKMLYASDTRYRTIFSWNNAPNPNGWVIWEYFIRGIDNIRGLAVDWISSHIYWTEKDLGYLSVAELDGFRQTILLRNLNEPKALAVDPVITKSLFWVEGDEASVIKKSNLDGSGIQILEPNTGGTINGIHIDYATQRLYWTDSATVQINSRFLNGTDKKTLIQGINSNYIQGPLTSYKDNIIWVGTYLNAANIHTGEIVQHTPHRLLSNIEDVISFDASMQPDAPDACGINNGGCEHLCLPLPKDQISCICSLGYKVSATDATKCESVAKLTDNFIIVADPGRKEIFQMDMQGQKLSAIKLESEHDFPRSMVVDPNTDFVYWMDTDIIKRIHIDGSQEEVFMEFDQVSVLRRMAIDSKARLMFYTNDGENQIGVITLNGQKYHKIIIGANSSTEISRPHDIEVDPEENRIYWVDWGDRTIEGAYYDGSGRTILASEELYFPFALSVDYQRRKIYWAEAMWEYIEQSDLDGGHRRIIYNRTSSFMESLHIHGDYLYFSDTLVNTIHRLYYNGSGETIIGPKEFGIVIDIFVYKKADFLAIGGPCANDNGGCSHICMPRGSTKACDCPIGQSLSDDNVHCETVVTCPKPIIQYGSLDIQCSYRNGTVCAINCDYGYIPDYPSARCLGTNWNISLENVCKERTCPLLEVPNGTLNKTCSREINEVCVITCKEGFHPKRGKAICRETRTWNTTFSDECVANMCPVVNGTNLLWNSNCSREPGSYCPIICAKEYEPIPRELLAHCRMNGTWTVDFDKVCHDVTPPVLNCTSDITFNADPGTTTKVVTFTNPTVSDNSGEFDIRAVLSIKSGVRFGEGTTVIHAYARDSAGNIGSCSFKVTVVVSKCPELILDTATSLVDRNCPRIHGTICQVKCKDGYYMKGATYFICSKTMLAGRSTPVYEWEHKGDGCIPIKETPSTGEDNENDQNKNNGGSAAGQSGSKQGASSPLAKSTSTDIVVALVVTAIIAVLLILCIAVIVYKRWRQPGGVFALFKRPNDDSSVLYCTQRNEVTMSASTRGTNGVITTHSNDYVGMDNQAVSGIANPLYEKMHGGKGIPNEPPTYSSIDLCAEGYDQAPPLPAKDDSEFSDVATLPVDTKL